MSPTQYSLFAGTAADLRAAGVGVAGLGEYDEMVSGDGRIRAHWRPLVGALQGIAEGTLGERVERIDRQYQDTALAFSLDNDRQTAELRRSFDIMPLVLPEEEWTQLEAGLAQRARLLDRLLADLYGPCRVLSERLLPSILVHGSPRFLRPCSALAAMPAMRHVHVYSADLIRGSDGGWRVLADRLQAPAGIGFALQNRHILARTLPEIFRAQPVQRIEPFFELWRDSLAAMARPKTGPARVVVLTPGPFNAAYFEHAYLARQLGATLVEGADLTVRDGRVQVKTLGALHPVDVILRFVEDDYCDPLELRGDSMLGVAGLLQAVRTGTVAIANALGASVVETPAIRAFLPRLAEALLGESLLLPSLQTKWLGLPEATATLPDRLGEVVVKPAMATRREEQAFAASFQQAGRKALLAEIRRRPKAYVAETRINRSVMPIWTSAGMVPRPVILRMFLVASGGSYIAMPGGLAQVPHAVSRDNARAEPVPASKDVWVLAGGDRDATVARNAPPSAVTIHRTPEELRSRSADDLFWLGRYAERLDNAARTMRSTLGRTVSVEIGPGQQKELHLLVRILSASGLVDASTAEWLPDGTALQRAIAQASARHRKLQEIFDALQRIARSLRDQLSSDMWQVVVVLLREARERLGSPHDTDEMIAALDHLVGVIAAFGGMVSENMTRSTGWRFLDIGRRIERGIYGVTVLRQALAARGAELEAALGLTLELFDSVITYRSRYLAAVQPGAVIQLVLADESNPRAINYQARAIADHLRALAATFERPADRSEQALLDIAMGSLQGVVPSVLDPDVGGETLVKIGELLGQEGARLLRLSDAITRAYFSQVQMPHPVGYEGAHI
jgi:uncharacterized circularly permuted ATP-grasp superfamily protein/uncharacterized alpha-E superfamily protein